MVIVTAFCYWHFGTRDNPQT